MDCCDVNGLDRLFRGPPVRREARAFARRGLGARQRAFFEGLEPTDKRILDIGCGVGALGLTALRRGAAQATFVDVSQAYLRAARELAETLGLAARARFIQGDALKLELSEAELVVLDRVVCCHPKGPELLERAAHLSREVLVFTYPRPTWYLRLGRALLNGFMRLWGHPYRFHLHEEDALTTAAARAGHRLVATRRFGIWQLCRYAKPDAA